MFTAAAVSPGTTVGELLFSVISLTTVYAVLLVIEVFLLVKYVRGGTISAMPEQEHGIDPEGDDEDPDGSAPADRRDDVLAFAY
jgi:cytochrome d ubiquinol oxidase subunit I